MSFTIASLGRSPLRLLLTGGLTLALVLALAASASAAGEPYYVIKNVSSGKVLMPENHRTDAGAPIVQFTDGNWGAQHWHIDREADLSGGQSIREFRNRHSKYCIYVEFEDQVLGRRLIQDQCEKNYNANARQWIVSSKAAMWAGKPFTMYSRNSGYCMDIYGAHLTDYTPAIQWWCHGGANQQFKLEYRGKTG